MKEGFICWFGKGLKSETDGENVVLEIGQFDNCDFLKKEKMQPKIAFEQETKRWITGRDTEEVAEI